MEDQGNKYELILNKQSWWIEWDYSSEPRRLAFLVYFGKPDESALCEKFVSGWQYADGEIHFEWHSGAEYFNYGLRGFSELLLHLDKLWAALKEMSNEQ